MPPWNARFVVFHHAIYVGFVSTKNLLMLRTHNQMTRRAPRPPPRKPRKKQDDTSSCFPWQLLRQIDSRRGEISLFYQQRQRMTRLKIPAWPFSLTHSTLIAIPLGSGSLIQLHPVSDFGARGSLRNPFGIKENP